jgi:DNA polymerase I-like protein with 3'-5' exonuclease and polymerase domains
VGEQIPDQEYKIWICPIYHPSYILQLTKKAKNMKKTAAMRMWIKEIKAAFTLAGTPVPDYTLNESRIQQILNPYAVADFLSTLGEEVTFDYETTGLKPHRYGQEIICVSVCDGKKLGVFPWFDHHIFRTAWREFLSDPKHKKIAHNIPFEILWSVIKFGEGVDPLIGDTLLKAHCLHNRKPVNAKYLTYAKFGVVGYDDIADRFIKTNKDETKAWGANALNHIKGMPIKDCMIYCAHDAWYEFQLHKHIQLDPLVEEGYKFFVEGAKTLSEVQQSGIHLNMDKVTESEVKCIKLKNEAFGNIFDAPEMDKWNWNVKFDPNKDAHLKHLLFKRLKLVPVLFTELSKEPALSEEALLALDSKFPVLILEYRRWSKALDYVYQFKREQINGKIYPSINLGTTKTYRTSITNPSFQNIPVRDEEVKNVIRALIEPSPGNKIVGYDYKAIEVTTAAVRTGDKNLLRYVSDKSTDMHRDTAMDLFFLKKDEVTKLWRYWAKNRFVFPEFYGSYFEQVAPDLWKGIESDSELMKHIKSGGVRNIKDFTEHVRAVEDIFWNERFFQYSQWKKEQIALYEKQGYIEVPTGFRYYGPMRRNEIINYQIQGPAAHILLWSIIQIQKRLKRPVFLRTKMMPEIHDQTLYDMHPEDEEAIDHLVWLWGTQRVREHWDWITAPLEIEKDSGEIDGAWNTIKTRGYLTSEGVI